MRLFKKTKLLVMFFYRVAMVFILEIIQNFSSETLLLFLFLRDHRKLEIAKIDSKTDHRKKNFMPIFVSKHVTFFKINIF